MWVEKEEGRPIFKGIVSDYLGLLKDRTGLDMQIIFDIPFKEALARGEKGQIDFFPCLSQTTEREKFLSFTDPYLTYPMVIIMREDAPIIGDLNDLKGRRFSIVKHLVAYNTLQSQYPHLNLQYVFTKTVDKSLEAVSFGRTDACIMNLAVATYYIQKKGLNNLKIAAPANIDSIKLSMGIRRDLPVLKGIIKKALSTITREEKDVISQRWIRVQYKPGVDRVLIWKWALGATMFFAIVIAIVIAWNRRLQKEILKKENAEKAHREIDRRLSTLIGNLPGIVYRCLNDKDWTMQYLSDGCENLTGYKPSELIMNNTVSYCELIVPEDYEHVWNEIQKAGDENRSYTLEYRIIDKNGNKKWVWEKGIQLEKNDGGLNILEGFISDITERKLAEISQLKSHETLLTVLNGINANIYVADMETCKILFMNKNMMDDFGRDLTDETCWTSIRGTREPCRHCTNDQLIDKNGNPAGVCTWQDKNPITNKWYINNDRAIQWPDGRVVRLEISTDISDYKYLEEEIRQARKMETIGTLTGGISHDFNNILGIILGNTELALEGIPKENPAHSNLEEIKTASLKATDIVKQLLSFSRRTEQKLQPLEIALVIKDALKFLRSTIPTTIDIEQDIRITDETILGDPIQINQVMMNLCINSSHAMEETGGKLTLILEKVILDKNSAKAYPELTPGNHVQIMFMDTGQGIDPEIIDRIFDPYFTTKAVGKGSGMGLAVVHGIVKNHNGAISIKSKPGKGTGIRILFPMADKKSERITAPDEELLMGCERVLFIDDEISIAAMSKEILERLGYTVETRTNPLEALELFQSAPDRFDIVITDMTMPHMTGVALSEKIIEIRPNIPIIIATGHSALVDEKKARRLGIAGYIMKPMSMATISKAIRKILDK